MKHKSFIFLPLLSLGLLWGVVGFAQDLPILDSIRFTNKLWTLPQLRAAAMSGESALQALSSTPSQVKCGVYGNNDAEGNTYNPSCSYETEDAYIEMKSFVCFHEDERCTHFRPTPLLGVSLGSKLGQFFIINGKKVAIGDRLDDHPFLTKWDQSRLPTYGDKLNLERRYNYALLFSREGAMVYIGTEKWSGWSNRIISEMYYVEEILSDDFHMGMAGDHSRVEYGYWRDKFERITRTPSHGGIMKPSASIQRALKFMDDNINIQGMEINGPYPNPNYIENQAGLAQEARRLRQAGIDAWQAEKERERKAKESALMQKYQDWLREFMRKLNPNNPSQPLRPGQPEPLMDE